MNETRIYHLLGMEEGRLLLVYYSTRSCYQFRVVTATGDVLGDEKIYYTVEAALNEGRKWLGVGDRL